MKYRQENARANEAKKQKILERQMEKRQQSRDRGGFSR